MNKVRPMAVAGQFYPAEKSQLTSTLEECFKLAVPYQADKFPRALIAPHAGYRFSGPIAASVYLSVADNHSHIKKVLLMGPSHRVPFRGIAMSGADAYASPLGVLEIDNESEQAIARLPFVGVLAEAHAYEHSLEVHVPFLQKVLPDVKIIPLVVGHTEPEQVAEVINALWSDDTLVVISSDLSHYLDYKAACIKDKNTTELIESIDLNPLLGDQACGCRPINGLLRVAHEQQLNAKTIDLRNSGDTFGNKERVVGYGGYVFT